jgi:hypothetical protein
MGERGGREARASRMRAGKMSVNDGVAASKRERRADLTRKEGLTQSRKDAKKARETGILNTKNK